MLTLSSSLQPPWTLRKGLCGLVVDTPLSWANSSLTSYSLQTALNKTPKEILRAAFVTSREVKTPHLHAPKCEALFAYFIDPTHIWVFFQKWKNVSLGCVTVWKLRLLWKPLGDKITLQNSENKVYFWAFSIAFLVTRLKICPVKSAVSSSAFSHVESLYTIFFFLQIWKFSHRYGESKQSKGQEEGLFHFLGSVVWFFWGGLWTGLR